MARSRLQPAVANVPRIQRGRSTVRLNTEIRTLLMAHNKWPYLTTKDWHPLARRVWGLTENLRSTDYRYDLIHQFCKNERNRVKKRETDEAQEPVRIEPEDE